MRGLRLRHPHHPSLKIIPPPPPPHLVMVQIPSSPSFLHLQPHILFGGCVPCRHFFTPLTVLNSSFSKVGRWMVLFHRYNPRWMLLYLRGTHEIDSPTAPRPLCPLRLRAAHSTHDFANRGEGEEKKKKESTLFSFSLRTACALLSFPREEGRHTTILSSCTKRSSGEGGKDTEEREGGLPSLPTSATLIRWAHAGKVRERDPPPPSYL